MYDYSKVEYKHSKIHVTLLCSTHGEFLSRPNDHLNGHGCKQCGIYRRSIERTSNTHAFIEKAKQIHGDKYDYSKVVYTKNHHKIILVCSTHGEFLCSPGDHINKKYGCSKCGGVCKSTTREFIENAKRVHGEDTYDYSKVDYVNNRKKITLVCKQHGDFSMKPYKHLQRQGCRKCAYEKLSLAKTSSTSAFIEKSREKYGDMFDYSKVEYKDSSTKVIIGCRKHGDFLSRPNDHLTGYLCPLCIHKTEAKVYEHMKPFYPTLLIQFRTEWCKKKAKLPYDFCIPESNIIIELDGRQHFEKVWKWLSPEEHYENDKYKEKQANENGYSTIRLLQEDVYYDRYDWIKHLRDTIEQVKRENCIVNIYLSSHDDVYKNY